MGKKVKGNGEGTIYKSNKTGLYIGQYMIDYKRHSVYQKKNEKIGDFKKRFNNILASINNGTYIEKTNETLYEILKNYIEQKFMDGITSQSSYLRDKETLSEIEKTCYNFVYKSIQKISIEDIEKAKISMRKYSQSIIDKIWILLRKGFKIAYSRRKLAYNVMENETLTKPFSEKEEKKVDALDDKEFKKLNKILDDKERNHKYRNVVKMQLETGMRIGETLARSIFNIDLKNREMTIDNTLTKDKDGKVILGKHTKTYNKRTGIDAGKRIIFINDAVLEIINEQIKSGISNISGLLFWDYDNNNFISYNEINAWLRRINEKYKITKKPLNTHTLRHTKITNMRKAGMDMKAIQYLVGHVEGSSITDDIYTTLTPEFLKQEVKKIK